jgi:YVTN family beta-propeller protein
MGMKSLSRKHVALTALAVAFLAMISMGSLYSSASTINTIQVVSSISVGANPSEMVFDSTDNSVFVINGGRGTAGVSDIDAATNVVITTQKLTEPKDIAYNPTNDEVYVTSENTGVNVIRGATGKLVTKISVDTNDFYQDIAYDPANGKMYVASTNPGEVSVISSLTNKVTSRIATGSSPQHLAYDPYDGNMYVFVSTKSTSKLSPFIAIISSTTNKVLTKIKLASSPGSYTTANLVYDPATDSMLVSDGGGNVYVISDEAIVQTISATVLSMVFNLSNNDVYALGENQVYVFSGSSYSTSIISTSGSYLNLAYDQTNGDVYVGGSPVNVIGSSNTLVAQVSTAGVGFVLYNPTGGDVYAGVAGSPGTIDVISSS